ncbi:MAG: lycopene cyclase domain-containing protein [Actinomycetes bacterium]
MRHLGYLAMLGFTVLGSFWLELVLKVRVLQRWRRVLAAILPVGVLFIFWDAYAIAQGHWHFDRAQILGLFGPFKIPVEEFLFFLIVPIAAIMTLEAVRKVKGNWSIGDEQ